MVALRRNNVDIMTTAEAGMLGKPDEAHLIVAVEMGRVLVTGNARDFWRIHNTWMADGRDHHGIVIIPVREDLRIGERLRRLVGLTESLRRASLQNQVVYLNTQWLGLR